MARGNAVSTDVEQSSLVDSRPDLTGSLSVLSGAQKGATIRLLSGMPVTVGRGIGNDIVIRDQSVEAEHVSLQLLDDGLLVNVMQGQITVDGTTHGVSESLQLPCTAQLQIGDVGLMIESGADKAVSGSSLDVSMGPSFSLPQSDDMHDMEVHDSEKQAVAAQVPAVAGSRRLSMWATGGIALLLTGGAVLWQGGVLFAPTPEPQLSMSAMLETSSFSTLSVQQQGSQVTLSGFLETSEESRQLSELIASSGYQVDNNVLVGESLGNQVTDVFRVNGVPAEVLVAEGGVVSATTSVAADTPFARLEETVMTDVPGVASIAIHNTPPPIEKQKDSSVKVDAGKRVAMVVSDYPAHIVTEDHSRYFVGSILPTGHRIASIDNGVVSLEKMGVQSKLEF